MKKYFTPLVFVLIATLWCVSVQYSRAQDPRFVQFYAAPMHLNPAMTGVFEGRFRANLNYRDQWSSILDKQPFRTFAAAFDMRYNIVSDDFIGFGVSAIRDEAAGDSRFAQTRGHLGLSYLKKLAGNAYSTTDQYLIAGAQAGLGQHSMNWGRLWFSEQFDETTSQPDFAANSGESGISGASQNTDLYLDINAGLLWYALFGDNTSIYAGGALNHINAPTINFFESPDEVLYLRWLLHTGGEIPFTAEMSLLPAVVFMRQGPSNSTTFGANIRYSNHDWYELAIRAGIWWHTGKQLESGIANDALTFAAILELERWNLGISYDINTSNLKTATNSRGAFELSLIYTHPAERRIKVNCPKF